MILGGWSQHLTIVAEAQGPCRPVQPAGELMMKDWDLHTSFQYIQRFHQLTWRSSEHTPAPPRPTDWPGRRCCPWRSTSPWDQTWCRCSLMGERWLTGWTSVLDNCEQKLMFRTEKTQLRLLREGQYLRILMQPPPLVRKNMSLSLFQEISLTSNLNCSSALERCVLASMKVTTSSLLPTAMVWPSGLQQMLMFSPKNIKRKTLF